MDTSNRMHDPSLPRHPSPGPLSFLLRAPSAPCVFCLRIARRTAGREHEEHMEYAKGGPAQTMNIRRGTVGVAYRIMPC